jgi:hypothetical protein
MEAMRDFSEACFWLSTVGSFAFRARQQSRRRGGFMLLL